MAKTAKTAPAETVSDQAKTAESAKAPAPIKTVKTTLTDDLHAAVIAAESLDEHAALVAIENLMGELAVKVRALGHHLNDDLRARFKVVF